MTNYLGIVVNQCFVYPTHQTTDPQGIEVEVSVEEMTKLVEDLSRLH